MGYLGYYNKLWEKINGRNLSVHMQNGLVVTERKVFEEETIREAINNAIIHRDYSEAETIRIIQTPYKLNIVSPGGFPHGVNLDNIADTTKTRNKLIADVLYKCEFVEQFGNGVNLMIKNQLSLGKPPPDYFKSDKFRVDLNIDGNIKDIEFAKYVMRIAEKLNVYLNDEELRLLYDIKENHKVHNLELANKLVELGIVEKLGINKFLLSKQYYAYINKRGIYTRRRGLDKETNKKLILEHLRHHQKGYMPDLIEALKNVPKSTINSYLSELREEGLIELAGKPSATSGANRAYWKIKKTV